MKAKQLAVSEDADSIKVSEYSHVDEYVSWKITRALSSAGSERLPYKQRVGGSNPSAPTISY